MQFLGVDHLARIFLKHYGHALYFLEQVAVKLQRRRFMLQRFAQDIADIVFVGFQQRADCKSRMTANVSDHFARLVCMGK